MPERRRILVMDLHRSYLGAQRVLVYALAGAPERHEVVALTAGEPRLAAELRALGIREVPLPMPDAMTPAPGPHGRPDVRRGRHVHGLRAGRGQPRRAHRRDADGHGHDPPGPPTIIPAGNLTTNPSFETDLAGWGAYQGTIARAADAAAPDGGFIVRVTRTAGTFFDIDDAPDTVQNSSSRAAPIRGRPTCAAGNAQTVGRTAFIRVREQSATGDLLGEFTGTVTLTATFQPVNVFSPAGRRRLRPAHARRGHVHRARRRARHRRLGDPREHVPGDGVPAGRERLGGRQDGRPADPRGDADG